MTGVVSWSYMKLSKSQFKPRMLEYFRRVQETGEPLLITEYNRPVLKITALDPTAARDPATLFEDVRAHAQIDDEALLAPTASAWPQVEEGDS